MEKGEETNGTEENEKEICTLRKKYIVGTYPRWADGDKLQRNQMHGKAER